MSQRVCRAAGCGKPIPIGHFCTGCLTKLDGDLRHRLIFGFTEESKAQALEEAIRALSGGRRSMPPKNPAFETFKRARAHTAKAREILERKPK